MSKNPHDQIPKLWTNSFLYGLVLYSYFILGDTPGNVQGLFLVVHSGSIGRVQGTILDVKGQCR